MPLALDCLLTTGIVNWRELEAPLAVEFELSESEVAQEYASGNGAIFLDRISWALSYLALAKLVARPKRGFYQVTELASIYIGQSVQLKAYVKEQIAARDAEKRAEKSVDGSEPAFETEPLSVTPIEDLNQAHENIRASSYEDILDTILSKTPYEFEKLVVKLLDKMGYGGQVKNAGEVTQASNDGGIDGIIKEDVLGLGRIHIQAKRYARDNSVGREEIQKFVGALAVAQSNKGVFITTSSYTRGAREYALNLNGTTSLVLIDGAQLAEYIYEYSLGMQVEQVIEIKKMDADYWDEMQNNVN